MWIVTVKYKEQLELVEKQFNTSKEAISYVASLINFEDGELESFAAYEVINHLEHIDLRDTNTGVIQHIM